MSDIAIRNGSIIVKDGVAAERCACCGCPECKPPEVKITIQTNDFLRHSEWQDSYGSKSKESYGIIASPLSGEFTLGLAQCYGESDLFFVNGYKRVYESSAGVYPYNKKIQAVFFNTTGSTYTQHFTIRIPITVCVGSNRKSAGFPASEYKYYSLEEMLTPITENSFGFSWVSVRSQVGYISATFSCTASAEGGTAYRAIAGPNVYDGEATDASEGAVVPCDVWQFDPPTTEVISMSGALGYGSVKHLRTEPYTRYYGLTELSRADVVTGANGVSVSSLEFDCAPVDVGACCGSISSELTSCVLRPQCECQGYRQTFKGVGTTCSPNPCNPLP